MTHQTPWKLITATLMVVVALMVSAISPYDRTTWLLEVFPIFIAMPILGATYRRFPLTKLLYTLIFLHALVLILGGAYTYARVPLGDWIAHAFELHRNPYDKVGHFFQGFVPALIAREILIRGNYIRRGRMLIFLTLCVVLGISASYELIEWLSAVILGQGAEDFLGMQGDPWDTHSDMLFALIGGSTALLLLSRTQDRQIAQLDAERPRG